MSFLKRLFGAGKTQRPAGSERAVAARWLGIELFKVPAGDFIHSLGADKKRMHLPAYEITKYPINVGQYRQFSQATGRFMPDAPEWGWHEN
jgi:formylglycine-generating enzyme required for sulfatase activity